ncbi:hypothetical protein KDL44_10860 [bacterium]|nr:hypothetical protein [bacterium]
MTLSQKLHDDPVVRALLWCLISDDDLSEQSLVESGLSAVEAAALIRDEERLLKRMCVRATVAERVDVKTLAMVLRNRLLEHLEMAEKAAELSSIIRSLRSLPDWLFPEWRRAAESGELDAVRQALHSGGTAA